MRSLVQEPQQLVYDAVAGTGTTLQEMQGVPVIAPLTNTFIFILHILFTSPKSYVLYKYPLKILNINSQMEKVHCNFLVVDKDPKFC